MLVEQTGGPGVFPYQPQGLWRELSYDPDEFTAQIYVPSRGADLYRRSVYTFWKRSVPPPNLEAFDAPSRETCVKYICRRRDPFATAARTATFRTAHSASAVRGCSVRNVQNGSMATASISRPPKRRQRWRTIGHVPCALIRHRMCGSRTFSVHRPVCSWRDHRVASCSVCVHCIVRRPCTVATGGVPLIAAPMRSL